MDPVETILLTAFIVVLGVIAGAAVQKKTYFLYPLDIFTILILAFVCIEVLASGWETVEFLSIGIDVYWYAPLMMGYIAGYLVSGRTRYIMIRSFSPDKCTVGEHWVVYTREGRYFRQVQSNRELLKRLLFGIEHEILTNADLTPDWDDTTKYPMFPLFRKKFLMAEFWETYELPPEKKQRYVRRIRAVVEVEPRLYLRRYVTSVRVARGSMVSRVDLVRDARALDRMQGDLIEANNEIFRLRQSLNIKMADTVAEFLADVYSKAPGASLSVSARRWAQKQKEKEKERERDAKEGREGKQQ